MCRDRPCAKNSEHSSQSNDKHKPAACDAAQPATSAASSRIAARHSADDATSSQQLQGLVAQELQKQAPIVELAQIWRGMFGRNSFELAQGYELLDSNKNRLGRSGVEDTW